MSLDRPPQREAATPAPLTSDDGRTLWAWPYCPVCHQPFSFEPDEPFAFCGCGTHEWGYPRPAKWIPDPDRLLGLVRELHDTHYAGYSAEMSSGDFNTALAALFRAADLPLTSRLAPFDAAVKAQTNHATPEKEATDGE